jgi:hypothetical protein
MRYARGGLRRVSVVLGAALLFSATASAHPVPFSYLDLRVERDAIVGTLVVHMFDVGHDLAIDPAEHLLDRGFVSQRAPAIIALLAPRLVVAADGRTLAGFWTTVDAVPERQSVRLGVRYPLANPAGVVRVATVMFPYDPNHQTFLNVYEGSSLTTTCCSSSACCCSAARSDS